MARVYSSAALANSRAWYALFPRALNEFATFWRSWEMMSNVPNHLQHPHLARHGRNLLRSVHLQLCGSVSTAPPRYVMIHAPSSGAAFGLRSSRMGPSLSFTVLRFLPPFLDFLPPFSMSEAPGRDVEAK